MSWCQNPAGFFAGAGHREKFDRPLVNGEKIVLIFAICRRHTVGYHGVLQAVFITSHSAGSLACTPSGGYEKVRAYLLTISMLILLVIRSRNPRKLAMSSYSTNEQQWRRWNSRSSGLPKDSSPSRTNMSFSLSWKGVMVVCTTVNYIKGKLLRKRDLFCHAIL